MSRADVGTVVRVWMNLPVGPYYDRTQQRINSTRAFPGTFAQWRAEWQRMHYLARREFRQPHEAVRSAMRVACTRIA